MNFINMKNIIMDTKTFGFIPILIFSLIFDVQHIKALYLTNLTVPRVVDFRDKAKLSCTYEMGTHKLNSVKWYKDGSEFFRYSPMMPRSFLTFPVNGVSITSRDYFCNQFICNVELNHITKNSSGAYRCEVSGDAPEFKLVGQQANMTVGVLPQYGPYINGAMTLYRFGDHVSANCTSDWSMPPSKLTWYINDDPASPDQIQQLEEQNRISDGFNLYMKSIELHFYINNLSFLTNGKLNLRCISDIMKIPALRRESTIKATILSKDDLNNEKLVNSSGTSIYDFSTSFGKFIFISLAVIYKFNRFVNLR